MSETRIIIVDDHPLFRDAMRLAIAPALPGAAIEEAASLDEAIAKLDGEPDCDLVLLDLKMPGVQGLSGLAFLRAQYAGIPVAIVSGQEEPAMIRRALALGASGFIPKSMPAETIRQAVKIILNGGVWAPAAASAANAEERETDDLSKRLATLTPQQVRVLMMLREGLLNKQIAYALSVSEATVKAHVSAVLLKLDVDSRTQAVIAAARIDGETASEAGR